MKTCRHLQDSSKFEQQNSDNMTLPPSLQKLANQSAQNQNWVNSLPNILQKLQVKWNLQIGNPYTEHVSCSYVAPCIVNGTEKAVLKIGMPHEEALHEIEGLQVLKGNPTVQLLAFDKASNSMLLEQCVPGTHLKTQKQSVQDQLICEMLSVIWSTSYPPNLFRPLAAMVEQWNRETYENLDRFPDTDLALKGCKLKEDLIASSQESVLLATDLHAGNVLKAERKPWLVIDIKPYVGDRTYDLTQHLFNNLDRLRRQPKQMIEDLAQLAEVDGKRLKDWLFARLASEFGGNYQDLALKLSY